MILAVLQARTGSTRLPGKVLMPILGEPMLVRQIERVRRCRRIDQLMIATTVDIEDDSIATLCMKLDLPCFRGSRDDVLDRFYQAAADYHPQHLVRLTGDCPLADPEIIDACIALHLEGGYDYTSNIQPPSYPDGLDVEVMTFTTLQNAWEAADTVMAREHVTYYIYQHPELFKIANLENELDLSSLRWTVDENEDFEFVTRVYQALYPDNPAFDLHDVLALLDKSPGLRQINSHLERNAKLKEG